MDMQTEVLVVVRSRILLMGGPNVRTEVLVAACLKISSTSKLNAQTEASVVMRSKISLTSKYGVAWSKAPVLEGTSAMVSSGLSPTNESKMAVLGWGEGLVVACLNMLTDKPNL